AIQLHQLHPQALCAQRKELPNAGILLRRNRTTRPLHRGILSQARTVGCDSRFDDGRGMGDRRAFHYHPLVAWRTPASQPSTGVGWYSLDLPRWRTTARPAGGIRQLEFDLAAVPPLV